MLFRKTKIITAFIMFIILATSTYGATQKKDESRFQFGFGIMASTGNLLNLIETVRIYQASANETDYNFPGLDDSKVQALQNLDGSMKRAILVANILGSMDYGFQFRILWSALMFETDISLLPFDASYNGRLDLMITPYIGVRAPFFIMPYLIGGPIFTFSFFPATFTERESWRSSWGTTSNFVFRPGINLRLGLELKLPSFSIGPYFQYTIKDFDEFTNWYNEFITAGFSQADAAGKIFCSQARFGLAINIYTF